MKKLKIAVWHNLPSGGGKRALYYHVKGLVERGHVVESWCPPTADQTYLPLNKLIKEHVIPLHFEQRENKNIISKYLNLYREEVNKVKGMDQHCRQCAEEINHGGFDILFANACLFFRVPSIARYIKIPKVIYLGEPYRRLYEALPRIPWAALPTPEEPWWHSKVIRDYLIDFLNIQALRLLVREEINNAQAFDVILVNSFYSHESVLRAYGLESKVCYLGIDANIFHNKSAPRENFVVGLGSVTIEKRLDRAIRAIGAIDEKSRPELVWIGNMCDEYYRKEMETLAASHGVKLTIKLKISDDEVVDTLNRAAVMIYTSQLEPFGLAPLEANACGLPVVAVAEGGVRETVIDGINGLLVGNDPKALGTAVERIMRDKSYARELSINAQKIVTEKWSMKATIDRLEQRLLEVLDKR